MYKKESFVGQKIGNVLVLSDVCTEEDWKNSGLVVSDKNKNKYVLGKCLNCGNIKPFDIWNLKRYPPKRCYRCSNIGNHSNLETSTNQFVKYEDYAIINIFYKNSVVTAYIDLDDYEICSSKHWRINKKRNNYYVVSGGKGNMVYLHQLVFGKAENGYEIDHIDGNPLNNRKNNLQYLTMSENRRKTKARVDCKIGIKGISYNKKSKKYIVDFVYDKKRYYFKNWDNIESACWCRYIAEEYFGLDMIKNNILFDKYNTLTDIEKIHIKEYTLSILDK